MHLSLTRSFRCLPIGEVDPGVCVPGVPLPCFSLGKKGSSGSSLTGNISGVGSPVWKPKSGGGTKARGSHSGEGTSGVAVFSGVLGKWAPHSAPEGGMDHLSSSLPAMAGSSSVSSISETGV